MGVKTYSSPPSEAEAQAIVQEIMPQFERRVSQYDAKKYPPNVYEEVRQAFQVPATVSLETLRTTLLWKYGKLGRRGYPKKYEKLTQELHKDWLETFTKFPAEPSLAFERLDKRFGPKKRFITLAFLLHLCFPRQIPIIDQHNFRAVNSFMSDVRSGWRTKEKPSRYLDIACFAGFTKAVLAAWSRTEATVPTDRKFDQFLMMYGKNLKKTVRARAPGRRGASPRAPA